MSLIGHDCCLRLSVLVTNVGLAVGFSDHWNWETEAQCKGRPQHERGETAGAKLDQIGGDCSVFVGDPSRFFLNSNANPLLQGTAGHWAGGASFFPLILGLA
jgi:hypothetical protein